MLAVHPMVLPSHHSSDTNKSSIRTSLRTFEFFMQSNQLTSKPHYPILDGLRGVASVIVVAFHVCEAHATSHADQLINHGYLAVDFFFALSGFVVGYAYDDRWTKMSVTDFFKRRLIRLQPMVVMGMIVGAAAFYFQKSSLWPGIESVPVWKTILVMVIGCTLIPVPFTCGK